MQRILNDPDHIVDEMLEGFLRAHKDIVEPAENPRVVRCACRKKQSRCDHRWRFRT